ncbi:MAG: VCBS repeat-containing protein [Actinomycetes bacterium]
MRKNPRLMTLRLPDLLVAVLLSSGYGLAILSMGSPACGGPPSPLLLSPVGLPVAGNQFHCDAGLTVMDWNRDGLPDLLFHDTGSTGSVTIYLNDGTLADPQYGHGIWLPYNSTETAPTTIEHVMARTFCDFNHDGRPDMVLYEGRLRYLPDIGTPLAPYWWTMWPNKPWFFPGSPQMCEENTRLPAGPESMFWNKGVFPRQVLTMTAADWDGDGLEDLIVCRFKGEAPGLAPVDPADTGEKWTPWMTAKIPAGIPPSAALKSATAAELAARLAAAPDRQSVFYRNVGTRNEPHFDAGLVLHDTAGAAIVAPNPAVVDLDGDGRLDIVACETPIHRNAFRVDWPTRPELVWFRRTGDAPDRFAPAEPVRDAESRPIPAGVSAVFHDMRGVGVLDMLVLDGGDRGSVRWYRNLAATGREPLRFDSATVLRGRSFPRFERSYQPTIADWFGKNSRDLILFGETDCHCKFALRRAALLRNTSDEDGPCSFRMEGYFNYQGNQDLVPVAEEIHQYDRYRSALAVVPGEPKRILASAGSKLFLFDQLAADGLSFQRMRPISLLGETNRMKGWQDIAIQKPQQVQYVRISNDTNGMGNFNDGHLHLLQLELFAGGRNIAAPEAIESVTGTRDDTFKKPMVARPMNMFQPGNANTDTELRATTFGFYRGGAVVKLKAPAAMERIRFLLSNRQSQWYNQLDSFLWQGRLLRVGFEEDEIFYHYKVEVSADGKEWTVVGDRTRNERISVFPQAIDWDDDGRWDILLGTTRAFCNWPQAKTFTLLRNTGTNDDPEFTQAIPLADEAGAPLAVNAHWQDQYAMHCGVKGLDLDGDGLRDLVIEGFTPKSELLFLKNVSPDPLTPRFAKPAMVLTAAGGKFELTGRYRYFDVADMDGDGRPDVVNCDAGMPVVFSGLAVDGPTRVDDLRPMVQEEGGLRVRWSVPASKPARWEVRWSDRPEIGEQQWATLPVQRGDYATDGGPTQEAVLTRLAGCAPHIAIRSYSAAGEASAVSASVLVAAPPATQVIFRNGPADGDCFPEYSGCTAATIDAASESKPFDGGELFESRSCEGGWGSKPKKNEKLAIVRFEKLPPKPARRAVLRLCINHAPLALSGGMEDRISVNVLPAGSWGKGATWLETGTGKPWQGEHATRGEFVSFAVPRRSTEPMPWIEWDVTLAVNAAAASPVATVDLLVRSEYIGHYTSLVGHKFFGTESKDVKRRPQLWLEYGHHRDADCRSAVRPGT